MRRLVAAAVGLALALAGPARADVFGRALASAPARRRRCRAPTLPNGPGSISFPATRSERPGARRDAHVRPAARRSGSGTAPPTASRGRCSAAINKIESNFGRNMGPSSAGAIGWMQFMPSTWERWGVDADGDGIADPWNPDDAICRRGPLPRRLRRRRATSRARSSRYNHAQWYVDEVLQLAQLVRHRRPRRDASTLDRAAGRRSHQSAQARRRTRSSSSSQRRADAARAQHAAGTRSTGARPSASLLSDRLALDQRAVRFGVRRRTPRRHVSTQLQARARRRPGSSSRSPDDRALAASFSQPAPARPRRAAYNGQYVFPVGGGPSLVSVSHHHHDYPAADIAAPEGSPVYALADATVRRRLADPDGRCGIGMTIDDRRRPGVDVLPHVVPRPGGHRGRPARRRHPGRPRRDDRPRHRPAPAPAARPGDLVPAAPAVVPELRRTSPSAGRTPARPTRSAPPATRRSSRSSGLRRRPHHADGGFEWTGRPLHPVGAHSAPQSSTGPSGLDRVGGIGSPGTKARAAATLSPEACYWHRSAFRAAALAPSPIGEGSPDTPTAN